MKLRKWLVGTLSAAMAVTAVMAFAACRAEEEERTEGPETGVYYCDTGTDEYILALVNVDEFTLQMMGESKNGTYTLTDGALHLDFASAEEADITASLADDVITLTYQGAAMRFLKKVNYTVRFDAQGGSGPEPVTVVNGRTVSAPGTPEYDGYTFVGWYTDTTYMTPFLFDAQPVTGDMTLYAYWLSSAEGSTEYTVDFELGYEGAEYAPVQTVEHCVIAADLPEPEREGYDFLGWYVSAFDDGGRLTYEYTAGTPLREDTTLYALWQEDGESALEVSVSESGVRWAAVSGASTYDVRITDADGVTVSGNGSGLESSVTSYAFDFSAREAGEYTVTVTAHVGSGTLEAARYYNNKALAAVSVFTVVEPSALIFEGVENAQRYYLTIECGNSAHDHEDMALGSATNYNFINCAMREGGIVFTVRAEADGYASSTSKAFVYNRELAQVTGLTYDAATETIRWNAVADAMSYVVSVGGVPEDIGNVTSYSIKDCAAGEVEFSIYPRTTGYNSPAVSTLTVAKASLAAPQGVKVNGGTLTWEEVSGATGYTVRVNGTEQAAQSNSFDLNGYTGEVTVSVRADGSNPSQWSDEQTLSYLAMSGSLVYAHNTLTWNAVIGATYYEVQVNDGAIRRITDTGATSTAVTLTQAGENVLRVRFGGSDLLPSDWAEVTVYAYEIAFDTRGGSAVQSIYVAYGDSYELPETERSGYTSGGWYNIPGGAAGNGALIGDGIFEGRDDRLVYAYWQPRSYFITYDARGGTVSETGAEVVFGSEFALEVPVNTADRDARYAFVGWYTGTDGAGVRYTDEDGASLLNWDITAEVTLYACWAEALTFVETVGQDGTDSYAAEAGPEIGLVTRITIPATYGGLPVTDIYSGAFYGCTSLKGIDIPDSIRTVGARSMSDAMGAFAGCRNLMNVNVYETDGTHEVYYSSADGVLILNSPQTGLVTIAYFPAARSGAYAVPAGVQDIPTRVFANMSVTEIYIPESVVSIRQSAFYGCDDLKTVTFEESSAEAQGLTIEARAFHSCTSLEMISLPARLMQVEDFEEVFYGCSSLEDIFFESGNEWYASVDGLVCDALGATAIFCPAGKAGAYVIPEGITAIGDYAFAERDALTSVTIGAYVESIGAHAFEDCSDLLAVTFLGSVAANATAIGDYAFYNCTELMSVVFEENCAVASIGSYAFGFCETLTQISVPSSITAIGTYAFYNCVRLSAIDIEGDVSVGDYAFSECGSLATVNLGADVHNFNFMLAFDGCYSIETVNVHADNGYFADIDGVLFNKSCTQIIFYPRARSGAYTLPASVASVGDGAFEDSTLLTSVAIGAGVTTLGDYAFYNCTSLTELTVKDGASALTVGEYALAGCTALTSLSLPARITSLGNYAFYLSGLRTIAFSEGLTSIGAHAFEQTALEEIELPDSVEEIGEGAFADCGSLIRVSLPVGMTVIGNAVFSGCSALSEAELPDTVKEIGAQAFEGCTALSSIGLPASLDCIGSEAFAGSGLADITIPASVTFIASGAFRACLSLVTVTFEEGTAPLALGAEGDTAGAFSGCTFLRSAVLPSNIGYIGAYTFSDCIALDTITFGAQTGGLRQIADGAFLNTALSEVVLPEGLVSVGVQAFAATNNSYARLEAISFPSTLERLGEQAVEGQVRLARVTFASGGTQALSVGDYAFRNAFSLAGSPDTAPTLTFPANLASIGSGVFEGCSRLAQILVADGNADFTSLDGVLYAVSGDTMRIVAYPIGKTGSYTVPEGVTSIPAYTFYSAQTESIVLPSTLVSIGDYAFAGSSITSIFIPAGVTQMGAHVFEGCEALAAVTFASGSGLAAIPEYAFASTPLAAIEIPANAEEIGAYAFSGCTLLESVTFAAGSKLASIGDYAFGTSSTAANSCGLESITIPATVTYIGEGAFNNCRALTSVTFEAGGTQPLTMANGGGSSQFYTAVRDDSYGVFGYCTSLESVFLPARLAVIPNYAFICCSALTTVTFEQASAGVTTIGNGAFRETGLTSFVLPDTVTSFAATTISVAGAFAGSASLTSVTLPANYTESFNWRMFYGCSALREVLVAQGNTQYSSNGGVLFNADGSLLIYYPVAKADETGAAASSYTVPYGTQTIGEYAFYRAYLAASTSRNPYLGVNDYAAVTEVIIPASVGSIGESAFRTPALQRVTFLEGTGLATDAGSLAIGSYAFSSISTAMLAQVASMELPARLTSLGANVFSNCRNLTSVTFAPDCRLKELPGNAFYGCTTLTSITLPEMLTSIGSFAFYGCSALAGITIPEGVEEIPSNCFSGCTSLTSITLPDTLTSIGGSAFYGCTALAGIVIPEGVTAVGASAFYNCRALTEIGIPASVTNLGANAFQNCSALANVTFAEGSALEAINNSTFSGCSSLTEIVIPESVTSIGNSAFSNCSSLEDVDFGSNGSLESIGTSAFSNCTSLTALTLPVTLTSIGNSAFSGCGALTEVELLPALVIIGTSAFNNCASLQSFLVAGSVTGIGLNAFAGCTHLNLVIDDANASFIMGDDGILYDSMQTTIIGVLGDLTGEVIIPDSVTSIPSGLFRGTSVTKVTLPAGITSIASNMFQDCTQLTEVVLLGRITEIGSSAFSGSGLQSISIGRFVTSIGSSAFSGCADLTSVTFEANGSSALTIGQYAFRNCTSLTAIDLPMRLRNSYDEENEEDVAGIGISAFESCTSLSEVMFHVVGGQMLPGVLTIGNYAFRYAGLASFTMPDFADGMGTTGLVINAYAFAGCAQLESFTFNSNRSENYYVGNYAFQNCTSLALLNNIPSNFAVMNGRGVGAFAGCTSLTSVTLPATSYSTNATASSSTITGLFAGSGVQELTFYATDHLSPDIGERVFEEMTALRTVTFSVNLSAIGSHAFAGCVSLQQAELPATLSSLGAGAFIGCSSLAEIRVDEENNVYCSIDGNVYTKDGATLVQAAPGKTGAVTLAGSVTSIADEALACSYSFSSGRITVTKNYGGFEGAVLALPASVATVAATAFTGWTAAQTINVSFAQGAAPAGFASGWSGGATVNYADAEG